MRRTARAAAALALQTAASVAGSPKQWSPCRCVIRMVPTLDSGTAPESAPGPLPSSAASCLALPSPASTSTALPRSADGDARDVSRLGRRARGGSQPGDREAREGCLGVEGRQGEAGQEEEEGGVFVLVGGGGGCDEDDAADDEGEVAAADVAAVEPSPLPTTAALLRRQELLDQLGLFHARLELQARVRGERAQLCDAELGELLARAGFIAVGGAERRRRRRRTMVLPPCCCCRSLLPQLLSASEPGRAREAARRACDERRAAASSIGRGRAMLLLRRCGLPSRHGRDRVSVSVQTKEAKKKRVKRREETPPLFTFPLFLSRLACAFFFFFSSSNSHMEAIVARYGSSSDDEDDDDDDDELEGDREQQQRLVKTATIDDRMLSPSFPPSLALVPARPRKLRRARVLARVSLSPEQARGAIE